MSNASKIPSQAKIVIIGGGIIGCSTAYHLAKMGCISIASTVYPAMFDRVINFLVSSLPGNLLIQHSRQRNPAVDFPNNHFPVITGLKRNLVTNRRCVRT